MKIYFHNQQKDFPLSRDRVVPIARALVSFLSVQGEALGLYFVTQARIATLHQQFFQDPTPTDCITFPIDDSYVGEIIICPSVALAYASKRGLEPFEEVMLYLVHGMLHLLGYDDLDPKVKRAMRKKEKSCMHHLKTQGFF